MYPKISVKEVNDNRIIVIGVEESNLKPCYAFGRAFKRVGKSTVKMGKDEIEKLILERKKVYWDEQIYEEAGLEDIDKEKVEWFLRKAKYERNFDVSVETPVEEASGSLVVTLRKYRISEEELEKLNERQRKVIEHLEVYKRISRSEYAKLTGCSERTAFRDLGELIKNKVVIRKGKSKKTYYELA